MAEIPAATLDQQGVDECIRLRACLTRWTRAGGTVPFTLGGLEAASGNSDAGSCARMRALLGRAHDLTWPDGITLDSVLPKQLVKLLADLLSKVEAEAATQTMGGDDDADAAYAQLVALRGCKRPRADD